MKLPLSYAKFKAQTTVLRNINNAPTRCILLAQVQIQIRIPLLQSRDQLHETRLDFLIGNNSIEVALGGAVLHLRNSVFEADLDLLGGLGIATSESLLQVQDGGRLDKQVLAVQVGALHALYTLHINVKDTHLAQRSDL